MKPVFRYMIAILVTAAVVVGLVLVCGRLRDERSMLTCNGIVVDVADSAELGFVNKDDVIGYVAKDYGTWQGQRLDSVDLRKIESSLERHSAILSAQAWTTDDGKIHITINQRVPVARFETAEGNFYADAKGFLFPLQSHFKSSVPIIDGNVPLSLSRCKDGIPASAKEREWLGGVITMLDGLGKNKTWKDAISRISVNGDGDLVLTPREGKEKFVFGGPEDMDGKFSRMEDYYKAVLPAAEADSVQYRTVIVKYKGQIICRK
jgi:cell division protein FtsQ